MWILALETSTDRGSCALWHDGASRESVCPAGRPHSETLLPLVGELLAEAGIGVGQLSGIAFGAGPGAFTGLRVACGAAQGLAVAADLPLLPVGSLETLAAASAGESVLALLDARMGEVYSGRYRRHGDAWQVDGEIRVLPPAAIELPDAPGWLAVGNALAAYPELALRLRAAGFACRPEILPAASVVAALAAPRLAAGAGIDAALAAPIYIRDKVAKTIVERLGEGGRA